VGPPPMVGWPTRGSRADVGDRGSSTFAAHEHPSPPSRHPWAMGPTLHPWVLLTSRRRAPWVLLGLEYGNFDSFTEPWVLPSNLPSLFIVASNRVGPPDRGSSSDSVVFRVNRGSPLGDLLVIFIFIFIW
jgi:hypothetical protein